MEMEFKIIVKKNHLKSVNLVLYFNNQIFNVYLNTSLLQSINEVFILLHFFSYN